MIPMSFEYEGEKYFLDFKYTHSKKLTWYGQEVETKNPNTTVFIMKNNGSELTSDEIYLSHTVGCFAKDRFSRSIGRITALRAVGKTLTKEFRRAMWEAYAKRVPPKPKKEPKVAVAEGSAVAPPLT
jgi:hypothetical protein